MPCWLCRVNFLHRQTDTTLPIDLEDLDLHYIALGQLIADFLNPFIRNL